MLLSVSAWQEQMQTETHRPTAGGKHIWKQSVRQNRAEMKSKEYNSDIILNHFQAKMPENLCWVSYFLFVSQDS